MSSVSAIFGTRLVAAPHSSLSSGGGMSIPYPIGRTTTALGGGGSGGLLIVCSSRPKKKATAHHIKTRPRKTQPWDIKRKPTVYPPLPPLPPDWTLVIPAEGSSPDEATSSPPPVPSA